MRLSDPPVLLVLLRLAAMLLPALVGTTPARAAYVMPPVAGVCTGDAGDGVGCGFDASRVVAFGLTVAPKKSVLAVPWCPEYCYAACPPTYPIPYECEDCVYQDAGSNCFRVPSNVQATAHPDQGGCYETKVADSVASYDEQFTKTTSHSSGFFFHHTHSKSVKKVYQMFFEKNYSMALSYKYDIAHSVTLVPTPHGHPQPSREFKLAALLLPKRYQGNEAAYRDFIDVFGTHYMSQTYMGGSALLTNYFHSCFLHTFSMKAVSEASSSSFLGIYNDQHAKGWGSAIDKKLWDSYSQIDLKLNGGNASAYGPLGLGDSLDPFQVAWWQSSLSADKLVPLTYELRDITDVMGGGWIDDGIVQNLLQGLKAYDAEIGVQMQQLQNSLVEKDNYTKPDWCKAPKPPKAPKGFDETGSNRRKLDNLPGCPALPPVPPHRRQRRRARRLRGDASTDLAAADTPQVPPIPGLLSAAGDLGSLFGRGYDPLYAASRGAVAEWHYDGWACKGVKSMDKVGCTNFWRDPASGRQFRKPDEIQMFNSPAEEIVGGMHLFVDAESYTKWHWAEHSTSINLGVFAYAHADASAYLHEILDTKSKVVAVKERMEVAYQMSLWDASVLRCEMGATCAPPTSGTTTFSEAGNQHGSSFALQRQALPTTCAPGSSDAAQYALFREKYGTHYVEKSMFGGRLQFMLVIDTSLYNSMTEEAVMSMTAIGFDLLFVQFGFADARVHGKQDVSTAFRQNTQVVLMAYGGNSLLLEEGDYVKWAASVPTNAAPINTTFREVVDLFDGSNPGSDDHKRHACMSAEVDSWLAKAKKAPARYRCGDAPGTTVVGGLPKPSKGHKGRRLRIIKRRLPTLEELQAAQAVVQELEEEALEQLPDEASPVPPSLAVQQGRPAEEAQHQPTALTSVNAAGVCDPLHTIAGGDGNGLIGKTFDIKSGEPRLQATPLTCKEGKVWWSPFTNSLQQIPDQLDFVDTSATCSREVMNTVATSTDAWKLSAEAYGFYIGISLPIPDLTVKIGYGFEKEVLDISNKLANYTKQMSTLKRDMSMYRLSFGATPGGAPLAIGGEMQLAMNALPALPGGYDSGTPRQKSKYDLFVKTFGTHYVAGADFGAHCEFSTAADKSFVSTKSTEYVKEQMGISIGLQMGGIGIDLDLGYATIASAIKQDAAFKQHAQSVRSCFGGDTTLLSQDPPRYDDWVKSVYLAPSWINGSAVLRPIGDLFVGKDAAVKRENLQDAVLQYLDIKKEKGNDRSTLSLQGSNPRNSDSIMSEEQQIDRAMDDVPGAAAASFANQINQIWRR